MSMLGITYDAIKDQVRAIRIAYLQVREGIKARKKWHKPTETSTV